MKNFLYLLLCIIFFTACKKDNKDVAMPLAIEGFLPNSGNAGTVVTIRGTGFGRDLTANTVSFNGTAANVMSVNDTMLIVQAPDNGATGPIAVTSDGHTTQGAVYTYQALSIHGISPVNGPAGTNVSLSGAGFTSLEGPATVTVNGHPGIVSNSNDTLIVVTVPAEAGSGPIEVTVNGEHAAGPAFEFQSITKIKPASGGAGTIVTINGSGFNTTITNNLVAFNGLSAKVISVNATTLVVTVPENVQSGPVSLTVNGQKTTGPVFTKVAAPFIQSVAPLSGPVGSTITITGDNFSAVSDEDSVMFNGMGAKILSASVKQLMVTVPTGATPGPLKIAVNGQYLTGPVFTVQALGVISLFPDNGLEGAVITVKGTGFSRTLSDNQVSINGLPLTVSAASDSEMTVIIPAGITTGSMKVTTGSLSATGPVFRRAGVFTFYKGPWAQEIASGLVVDSKGNVFVGAGSRIGKITPDGVAADFAGSTTGGNKDGMGVDAQFGNIYGLVIDAQDNIYVSDGFSNAIRKVTPDGNVTTLLSGMTISPRYITIDPQGNLYIATDYNGIYLAVKGGTGIQSVTNGGVSAPFAYYNGYVFTSGPDQNVINRVNTATKASAVYAGVFYQSGYIDGPLGTNRLFGPGTSIYDPVARVIYFIDGVNYSIRTLSPDDGIVGTVTGAGGTREPFKAGYKDGMLNEALFSIGNNTPLALDKDGNIYVIERNNGAIRKIVMK